LTLAKKFFFLFSKVINLLEDELSNQRSRVTLMIASSCSFHRYAVVMVACRGAFPLQPPCLSRDTTIILLAKTWVVVNPQQAKHEPWLQLSGVISRQAPKAQTVQPPLSLPSMRRRVASAMEDTDRRQRILFVTREDGRSGCPYAWKEAFTPLPLPLPHP